MQTLVQSFCPTKQSCFAQLAQWQYLHSSAHATWLLDTVLGAGSCSDLETYSVYASTDPPPMVQQQELQPLVPCSSTSSEMGGRLSSLDLGFKFDEQSGSETNDQAPDTKWVCLLLSTVALS